MPQMLGNSPPQEATRPTSRSIPERGHRIERRIPAAKGLSWGASSGEEMGGGADDFLAHQASQPAHSLVQEGRKLAGLRSACLRPHLAQSGGFRIESKRAGGASGATGYCKSRRTIGIYDRRR